MLPKLTSLQYLVLNLLFAGRQSGGELRETLRRMGVRQSRTAFSRLMARLVEDNYVDPQSDARVENGKKIHYRCYEVTDHGVLDWTAARKFYLNLAPPSVDLAPVATDAGRAAPYDPKTRQAIVRREVNAQVRRFASAVLGVDLKALRNKAR